ncbi:MAG: hypothetical protein H8E80_09470 [Desulfobacteraceae bacterium]|uniref:Uncharacterized protein n=1 Tax=Candidatus Desulfaltia bathyphila TaxID=2841697 RepID=A0A8J6N919_9BACT|nr:hypothetical protein [Candidatus Desulfaltia bathyphila]
MNILDKVKQPENRKLELKRSLPPRAKWLKSIMVEERPLSPHLFFSPKRLKKLNLIVIDIDTLILNKIN